MGKLGKLSPIIQRLCYDHAFRLVVTEVFCVKVLNDEVSGTEDDAGSEYEEIKAMSLIRIMQISMIFELMSLRQFLV
jgi:hypothetical protein